MPTPPLLPPQPTPHCTPSRPLGVSHELHSVFPILSQGLDSPASKHSSETVQRSMSHLGMAWSLLISRQHPLQAGPPTPSISVHAKFISWEGYTNSLALSCCKEAWLLRDGDTGSGCQPRQGGTDRHGTSFMLRLSLCPLHSHHCLPRVKRAKLPLPTPSTAAPAGGSY